MGKKVRHTIWMDAEAVRRLKKIAALAELSQGDLVKTMIGMRDAGFELTPNEIEQAADAVVDYMIEHPKGGK